MFETISSQTTKQEPREKRLRVQRGRSSTGCQPCKSRHLKCDEAKPECRRCIRAGISCRYAIPTSSHPANKFIVYAVPRALPENPDLVHSERRSLYYFRCKAAFQLTAPFQSSLWVDCVFQLAERHSFVQSALVALSSMHESYTQEPSLREAYRASALYHYNKAMHAIGRVAGTGVSICAVLVSSVIFYTLESLRGSFHLALQHAQSGLKIMSQHRHRLLLESSQPSLLITSLDRDFLALQNKSMELGTPSKSRAYDTIQGYEVPIPERFVSVDDALYYTEVIYNDLHCLIDYCESLFQTGRTSGNNFIEEIGPRYEQVCQRSRMWEAALVALDSSPNRHGNGRYAQGRLILGAYRSLLIVLLENAFANGDCFEAFNPGLAKVLDYVETFLVNQDREPTARQSSFSLSLGVIPPLFMLSCRCNYPPIRDRALRLLGSRRRREGVWDSATTLQIAQRVIALRTRLSSTGNPRHVQVTNISFVSETACKVDLLIDQSETLHQPSLSPTDGRKLAQEHVEIVHLDPIQLLD